MKYRRQCHCGISRIDWAATSGLLKIKLSTISGLETGQHRTVPRHRANRSATSSPTICMAVPDAGGRRSNCRPSHQSTNYHQGIHRYQGFLLFCCFTGDGRTPTKAKSRPSTRDHTRTDNAGLSVCFCFWRILLPRSNVRFRLVDKPGSAIAFIH